LQRRGQIIVILLAAVALVSVACSSKVHHSGTGSVASSSTSPAVTLPPLTGPGLANARVAVLVMENHELSAVLGNAKAPYLNRLAHDYAYATQWYGIRHPSLPNYLAMIGGSTFGVTNDCTDCNQGATSLADQLEGRGLAWKAYLEGVPRPCHTGSSAGRYAKKHNPFAYFTGITSNPARCARMVPFDQLAADENAGSLPRFSFITPDLCNDTHDCSVDVGDAFLARTVPPLLDALGPDGLLIVTYDEGDSDKGCCRLAAGGNVLTVFAGGLAARGVRIDSPLDHFSMLRAVEDLFGLDHLRDAGCDCTPSARALLHS
jgi:hypothetical protein